MRFVRTPDTVVGITRRLRGILFHLYILMICTLGRQATTGRVDFIGPVDLRGSWGCSNFETGISPSAHACSAAEGEMRGVPKFVRTAALLRIEFGAMS